MKRGERTLLTTYIIRRVLQAIPLLFIISIISFLMMALAPGDPTAQYRDPSGSSETVDLTALREHMGIDDPIPVRYVKWMKLLFLEGNLGYSLQDGRPVLERIVERIPATFTLVGTAIVFSFIIAIPLGILSATKQYSFFDYTTTTFSFLGVSIPSFWFALMSILVFSLYLGWFPPSDMRSNFEYFDIVDRLHHLALPAMVLSIGLIASKSRYMRSSMLEVIKQDYVRTARAKGLKESKVIYKHALRNALLPIITLIGFQIPSLFGGALFIENIFAWPGLGRLGVEAIFLRDYQMIMGVVMIGAVLVVIGNLVADILYAVADPRIHYGK
jgi:peptide/nickel transport system permease protein